VSRVVALSWPRFGGAADGRVAQGLGQLQLAAARDKLDFLKLS